MDFKGIKGSRFQVSGFGGFRFWVNNFQRVLRVRASGLKGGVVTGSCKGLYGFCLSGFLRGSEMFRGFLLKGVEEVLLLGFCTIC